MNPQSMRMSLVGAAIAVITAIPAAAACEWNAAQAVDLRRRAARAVVQARGGDRQSDTTRRRCRAEGDPEANGASANDNHQPGLRLPNGRPHASLYF
jgi:hypothetical protein